MGRVQFGDLRRLEPVSNDWGSERGSPVDRYYIESFLKRHAGDFRGRALEVKDSAYTRRFGGSRVEIADVLDIVKDNPQATVVADLAHAEIVPSNTYDCIILTQTLQFIYDVQASIQTLHRLLRPGGVLLATFPGISQLDRWSGSTYWSFTADSVKRLAEDAGLHESTVEAHGNVLAAIAFLQGLAAEELDAAELDHVDPFYPVLITLRATKTEQRL